MRTKAEKMIYGSLVFSIPFTALCIATSVLMRLHLQPAIEYEAQQRLPEIRDMVASNLRYDVTTGNCTMNYLMAMVNSLDCYDAPYKQAEYGANCDFPEISMDFTFLTSVSTVMAACSLLLSFCSITSILFAVHENQIKNLCGGVSSRPAWIANSLFYAACNALIDAFPVIYGTNNNSHRTGCLALTQTLEDTCRFFSPINITHPGPFLPECLPAAAVNATYSLHHFNSSNIPNTMNHTFDQPFASANQISLLHSVFAGLSGTGLAMVCVAIYTAIMIKLGYAPFSDDTHTTSIAPPKPRRQNHRVVLDDNDNDDDDDDDLDGDTDKTPLRKSNRGGYGSMGQARV